MLDGLLNFVVICDFLAGGISISSSSVPYV